MRSPEIIVHGNSSPVTAESIKGRGFEFKAGRETVSQDFFFGLDWASNPGNRVGTNDTNPVDSRPGSLFIMRVPDGYRVNYGNETSIHLLNNTIVGHVGKFTGGRKQLGIYPEPFQNSTISPDYRVVELKATPGLVQVARELKEKLFSLEMSVDGVSEQIFDTVKRGTEHDISIDDIQLKEVIRNLIENSLINFAQEKIRSLFLKLQKLKDIEINDIDGIPGISYDEVSYEEVKKEVETLDYYFNTLQKSTQILWLDRYIKRNVVAFKEELSRLEREKSNNTSDKTA
jgi:hypothetical protein